MTTTIIVQARDRFFFVDIVNKGIYNAYNINKGGKRGAMIYTGYGCLLFMDIFHATLCELKDGAVRVA